MNFKLFIFLLLITNFNKLKSQIIFDPTLVYDTNSGLFDNTNIQTLYLDFYDNNYHDSLTAWWFTQNETRFAASLDMNTIHFDSVGVKYKGNSTFYIANSLNNPKVPYNIDINFYVGGQKLQNYKKLKIGNALFDPSFMKEVLAASIYNEYLPSHQASLINLYVNNNYLGIYTNTESINKQFLNKHFNEKTGAFYKCEPATQYGSNDPYYPSDLIYRGIDTLEYNLRYERKSDSSWINLINLIDILNNNTPNLENVLNIDRVLWYFAINTVLLNEDTYNTMYMHNYYFYQLGDGRFQIIPWDVSESFCGGLLNELSNYNEHYLRDPRHGLVPFLPNRPLIHKIISNPKYEKQYYAHINTIIENSMDTTQIKSWLTNYQTLAQNDVFLDQNKLFTNNQFYTNIDTVLPINSNTHLAAIMETLRHRLPYLDTLSIINYSPPIITNLQQSITSPIAGENVYITANVTNTDTVFLMTTTSIHNSGFTKTQMYDNGLNGDVLANDNIYTAIVPHNNSLDHVKYYIRAQNNNSIKLDPQKAEYFFYHYVVDYHLSSINTNNKIEINLYPNPTKDKLSFQSNKLLKSASVTIYDIKGKTIQTKQINNMSKFHLNVSDLDNGMYFVLIQENNQSIIKKMIINH